ncbi:MAG: HlyC/CorC family transporter [Planctomycetes bacterium]|nr:HlyC/CorC family transporter [Planctomycetota bacterium]
MLSAILLIFVLLLLNGVFAMSELAMMTSRRSRLQHRASQGSKGAATALVLGADPSRFLSTVQVGITLIGILSGAFAEKALASPIQQWVAQFPQLREHSDDIALLIVVIIVTYASLVFGELVPKRVALAHPEFIAAAISRPLSLLAFVAAWPVKLLSLSTDAILTVLRIRPRRQDDVSEEDVKSIVSRAASIGVFTRQEHALISRTMRLRDLAVRDIMTPRAETRWLRDMTTKKEVAATLASGSQSYYPVCKGGLDRVLGFVTSKDIIVAGALDHEELSLASSVSATLVAHESMPALRMLEEFKRAGVRAALVVDEYGSTLGMLSMDDLVNALVGDVSRFSGAMAPMPIKRKDGAWVVDGRLALFELQTLIGLDLGSVSEVPQVSTIGGLVLSLLKHIPHAGESVEIAGWRIEVTKMDGLRIAELLASRIADSQRP